MEEHIKQKELIFKDKAIAYIDWANVYGWRKSLKREPDPQKLFRFIGDGDYESFYKMLIRLGKQVLVIYTAGHLGREIWSIKSGLFKAQLKNLMDI